MSSSKFDQDDAVIFSLSDLFLLCRRKRSRIIFSSLLLTLIACFLTLSKNSVYEVEATFKEKEKNSSSVEGSLSSVLGISPMSSQENEAISLMRSRKLMEPIVKELNLQASIAKRGDSTSLFKRIFNNLRVQWAHLRNVKHPIFPDKRTEIICRNIQYDGEVPLVLSVNFISPERFEIRGLDGKVVEKELGERVVFSEGSFALASQGQSSLSGQKFQLVLLPLATVAKGFADSVSISPDEDDKTLLKLEFAHTDRSFAAEFVNKVMESYQQYLIDQNDKHAETQLAYLKKRRKESDKDLREVLTQYAHSLSSDVYQTGFPDSDKEMEFLARAQLNNKQRIMALNLELKRIADTQEGDRAIFDRIMVNGENKSLTNVMNDLRSLKQHRDSIELSLRQIDSRSNRDLREGFESQLAELDEVETLLRETSVLREHLENGSSLPHGLRLQQHRHFLVGEWSDRLEKSVAQLDASASFQTEREKEKFSDYLENLERSLGVEAKTIEERLAHQQDPHGAYHGIDLESAQRLYITLQKDLSELEVFIRQNIDLMEQMRDPDFDITSLSQSLSDTISMEMMQESSRLLLLLKDQSNRTEREQERINNALQLQREFLSSHVRQQTHLLKLKKELFEEKNESLMRTMLDLIHREITILDKHVYDHIVNRKATLLQERELLNTDVSEIRGQMSLVPERWVTEQLIHLHMSHNEMTLKEISKLVESKNISHNLETIESSPVDTAIRPILPRDPKLILYAAIGGSLGLFLSTAFVILRAIATGMPVSEENLRLSGQHVAGSLSSRYKKSITKNLGNNDLETLRRVVSFLPNGRGEARRVLLAIGSGPQYAHHLCHLLAKKGKKSLLIEASFDRAADPNELPALLQVLEKKEPTPLIIEEEGYHRISAGGITRYSAELLASVGFETLLKELEQEYDYLFVSTENGVCQAEVIDLFDRCHTAIISVGAEKLQDLRPYTDKERSNKGCFVLFDPFSKN